MYIILPEIFSVSSQMVSHSSGPPDEVSLNVCFYAFTGMVDGTADSKTKGKARSHASQ